MHTSGDTAFSACLNIIQAADFFFPSTSSHSDDRDELPPCLPLLNQFHYAACSLGTCHASGFHWLLPPLPTVTVLITPSMKTLGRIVAVARSKHRVCKSKFTLYSNWIKMIDEWFLAKSVKPSPFVLVFSTICFSIYLLLCVFSGPGTGR